MNFCDEELMPTGKSVLRLSNEQTTLTGVMATLHQQLATGQDFLSCMHMACVMFQSCIGI